MQRTLRSCVPLPRTIAKFAIFGVVFLSLVVAAFAQEKTTGRVLVIGFDGLDHDLTQKMMNDGILPNLEALAARGGFLPLSPTTPAQSPVSWSSMATGMGPGKTGIDDFLARDFSHGDVRARLGLVDLEWSKAGLWGRKNRRVAIFSSYGVLAIGAYLILRRARRTARRVGILAKSTGLLLALILAAGAWISEREIPDGRPIATNARKGRAYWEILDEQKMKTVTVLAPCAFPSPDLDHGHLLCGLGVPDAQGSPGFWTLFSDDCIGRAVTQTGGTKLPLVYEDPAAGHGRFKPLRLDGPIDPVRGDGRRTSTEARFSLDRSRRSIVFSTDSGEAKIERGKWSSPIPFRFDASNIVSVHARARAKFLDRDAAVTVYLEPMGFAPARLPFGLRMSTPKNWAAELEQKIGPYETVGWACATNALKDAAIDDATFLEDARRVWDEQESLARAALASDDWRVYTVIFTVPDRLQHMFTDRVVSRDLGNVVEDTYRRADRFIGEVLEKYARPEDLLLVTSDHGFSPWRRAVNLNSFLLERGYLVLKSASGARSLHEDLGSEHAFAAVDWQKTKAYSLGLGRIYLNRAGREPEGIVQEKDAGALLDAIEKDLFALRDGGEPVLSRVDRGPRLYVGNAVPNGSADIYVSFRRGWRVSWESCLGGTDEPILSDNASAWRGDHCSIDPELVRGVIFSSKGLIPGTPRMVDIVPTILDFLGVQADEPGGLDGRSLLPR